MATNRYCIDVAKRGTAGCKECKVKIDKGMPRIAKIIPNPFNEGAGDMKQWFHCKCIFEKLSRARATTKKIDDVEDLEGWDDLDDEHKPEVLQYIKEYSSNLSTKKSPQKKNAGKPSKKTKNEEKMEESDHDDVVEEEPAPTKDDTLRQFRKIVAEVSDVSEYKRKTAIISKFLSKGSDGNGFTGNLYLWVKMLLPMVEKRVYNLQNKQLIKLFSEMFGADQEEMLNDFEENGKIPDTISEFFDTSTSFTPTKKSTLYLQEVDKFLDELSHHSKEAEQSHILKKVAKKCTSNDLKIFIRFIKHDLSMNAGPKHVLEGVHPDAYDAFQASRNLKDIINRCLKQKAGKDDGALTVQASLMTPVLPMLAMVCGSPMEPFKKFPEGFYVEVKYDGERVQLHKKGDEFSYFSRSLKPVMPHKVSHLKNYIPEAFPHGNSLIIDCEILLVDKDGIPLPFGTLGAHRKTAFQDANVCLYVFDCLQFNKENLMDKPLWKRRKILEENMITVDRHVMFSELKEIKSIDQLSKIITSVIDQGLEGLVIKGKNTVYEPGKRHWMKLKKDYLKGGAMADTADLVVLGGYYGTGRKGGKMSVFLMGCFDSSSGKWCTVTKVPGGDDDTIEDLNNKLEMKKIFKDPANVPSWLNINKNVIPDFITKDPKKSPVWAISGAEFSKADIHTADGISIRFPRVAAIRNDKSWKEATSLDELKIIFEKSKNKSSDLIGLAAGGASDDDDAEFEFCKSSQSESQQLQHSKAKKFKKESSEEVTPTKLSKRRSGESSKTSDNDEEEGNDVSPKKKSKRRYGESNKTSDNNEEEGDDVSPKKKSKGNTGESSKISNIIEDEVDDASPKKKAKLYKEPEKIPQPKKTRGLPNVFTGVMLFIPSSSQNYEQLKRYFLAYDGHLLKDHQKSDASHVLMPLSSPESSHPKNAVRITVDWIWDSVKLQKRLSENLYKPK